MGGTSVPPICVCRPGFAETCKDKYSFGLPTVETPYLQVSVNTGRLFAHETRPAHGRLIARTLLALSLVNRELQVTPLLLHTSRYTSTSTSIF